jgi:iron complex transport system ATP-binding protein
MEIVNFENINIGYDYRYLVLKEINLKINAGEHWVILGSNGSGKTTLLKLMSNDLYPNTHYEFKKQILGKEDWDIFDLKKHLGIITNDLHNDFKYNAQYSTGFEIVRSGFFASLGKIKHHVFTNEQNDKTKSIMKSLDILDLSEKKAKQMSTGELRKCIIARALIFNPKALLLDEPTSGLDIKAQLNFLDLIRKLTEKLTIIIITHHLEEIIDEVTHVALIAENRIFKQGIKEEVLTSQNISKVFDLNVVLKKEQGYYCIKRVNS